MVARGRGRELSSTYQSFDDAAPSYSYLDLSRARSDESLLWSASDEAALLVAELRASLSPSVVGDSQMIPQVEGADGGKVYYPLRSRSFTNLSIAATSTGNVSSVEGCDQYNQEAFLRRGYEQFEGKLSRNNDASRFSLRRPPKSRYGASGVPPPSPTSNLEYLNSFGGSWRSLLKLGAMSSRGKNGPIAKKVAPPTVPDGGGSSSSSTCSSTSSHRHSGSSLSSGVFSSSDQRASFTSSLGEESASNPPPSPRSPGRDSGCDQGMAGSITSTGSSGSSSSASSASSGTRLGSVSSSGGGSASPSHYQNAQFTFPSNQVPQFAHLMCPKVSPGSPHHLNSESQYTYLPYQQQTSMEDQGIDVQSPGRSSPGSGSGSSTTGSTASSGNCRNSTTSLDSGRASSSTNTHTHRLSGQSYDSTCILRHSYHSSSSSLGSMEQEGGTNLNVHELFKNGVPDSEILRIWLSELHYEEYYDKFISAGYDMPTISRMTPEDLNAIGITKPAHRKKLKAEISRLNISDGLPDYIPSRLEEWLSLLRLENYCVSLKQQNYSTVEQVTQITWEDLEDVGITKLGHQKKVMLAIKRVKDIIAGKKFTNTSPLGHPPYPPREMVPGRDVPESYSNLVEMRSFQGNQFGPNRMRGPDPGGQPCGPNNSVYHPHGMLANQPNHPGGFHYPVHPSPMHLRYPGAYLPPDKVQPQQPPVLGSTLHYRPDVVAVNVRNSRSGREEEPIYGTYHSFIPDQRFAPQGVPQGPQGHVFLAPLPPRPMLPLQTTCVPHRSLDDGDITPTNEVAVIYEGGGGTLPRPRSANKFRPVAKVTAKTRVDVHEIPEFAKEKVDDKLKGNNFTDKVIYNASTHSVSLSMPHQGSASTNNTPQGTPKKLPPPPPRRSNSISESTKDTAMRDNSHYNFIRRGLSYGYMGVKNNLQPDVAPNLPPPPPAPQDRGNHQHLPEDFPPPPPPLTCLTMANSAASRTTTVTTNASTSAMCSEVTAYSPENDAEVGFRPRRNESNASFKSTSSTDSGESLPFANDNAGTIKQRTSRPHTGFALMDARSSPRSSPLSSPAIRRKEGIVLPTIRQTSHTLTSGSNSVISSNSCPPHPVKGALSSPEGTNDVLSDIGNMLANLTDELDAMLEHDLAIKN